MLLKKLSLATLACLVASGCIITSADDDGGSDTEATTNTPTTDPTASTTDPTASTTDPSGSTTDPTETTVGTTGEPGGGACGWGPIAGNEEVPNGYQCGFDGEVDPDGVHPIECSPNAILELGGDCTEAGVTAEGCCDANGDVWYCIDPDGDGPEEPVVGGDECDDPVGTDTDATDTDTDTDATDTDATDTDATDTDATDTDTDTDTGSDTEAGTTTGK